MIAKGLDFPNVSLVGVINADSGLYKDSYRASEDQFNLLMQVAGRSGRANIDGEVIIQTDNANHYIYDAIKKQNYNLFYEKEIKLRHILKQPPFIHLINFI